MRPKIESDARLHHLDEENRQPNPEFRGHSFIVKVWLEEVSTRTRASKWRGRIIHVPDGEKRYLQDLREIISFIAPYLRAMGVRPGRWNRIKRWLFR
jgi:hypothetical protein